MQATYNLRYRKTNFFNKILLTKEGELVFGDDGFTLKGKGANDKGQFIHLSDIKELYVREDSLVFVTFAKEKYTLTHLGNMYEDFLVDFYRLRNDFLSQWLFMKQGEMKLEYEGNYEYLNQYNKPMHKGKARIQIYEGSIVVLPQKKDAFMIPFNFLQMHEFDEMDYNLKCVLDNGSTVFFHQLGSVYEQFQEHFNTIAAEMYQKIVNKLKNILPQTEIGKLLKLCNLMKHGKAVSFKAIQKIDKELAQEIEEVLFKENEANEKIKYLRSLTDEANIHYGICVSDYEDFEFKSWYLAAIPEKNCVIFEVISDSKFPEQKVFETFIFQIIMERGNAFDKVKDKVLEINQTMLNLDWSTDPFWKDKKELRKGPFKYAIRKLPYLRILRKSFVSKFTEEDVSIWKPSLETAFVKAEPKQRIRHHGRGARGRRGKRF